MRSARRAAGPTTCCGTTRRTPSTCSPTRPARRSCRPTRCRADPSDARHRDGHVDPAARRRTARSARCSLCFNNDGPLGTFFRYIGDTGTYLARYDDLFDGKEEKIDVSQGRRVDERHRAAGPRILRRDPRRPRAEFQRRRRCCPATACCISSNSSSRSLAERRRAALRRCCAAADARDGPGWCNRRPLGTWPGQRLTRACQVGSTRRAAGGENGADSASRPAAAP